MGNTPLRAKSAIRSAAVLLVALGMAFASTAAAQEAGWHYSPFSGEGDRASLGCAAGSDETHFACLAVRCEDDYTVGVHVATSQPGGDAGGWRITIDEEPFEVTAAADSSPYHARIGGDTGPLLDALRNGSAAYLTPVGRPELDLNPIPLTGSLYTINQALYFCAPRTGPEPAVPRPRPPPFAGAGSSTGSG